MPNHLFGSSKKHVSLYSLSQKWVGEGTEVSLYDPGALSSSINKSDPLLFAETMRKDYSLDALLYTWGDGTAEH